MASTNAEKYRLKMKKNSWK